MLAAAVGLSRIAPPAGRRMPCPVAYTSINSFYLSRGLAGRLDRRGWRGDGGRYSKGDEELVEYTSFSPWRDESGRWQVVGRWSWGPSRRLDRELVRPGSRHLPLAARCSTTSRRTSSPSAIRAGMPAPGPACCSRRGTRSCTSATLEPAAGPDAPPTRPSTGLGRLTWNCPLPCAGGVFLSDPCWPSDPRLRNILFVGLRGIPSLETARRVSGPTEILVAPPERRRGLDRGGRPAGRGRPTARR